MQCLFWHKSRPIECQTKVYDPLKQSYEGAVVLFPVALVVVSLNYILFTFLLRGKFGKEAKRVATNTTI